MFYNASNNAWSRLSSAISASATSLTVQGGNWPEPPFLISIEDEIIEVNNKSGNTFSNLVRGMEGTTPAPHPANARVENRFTAGTYSLLKDVLTDSRIVEHNLTVSDPSNGWYIRWNNGLQVCWHSDVRRFPIASKYDDTFYYSQVTWHFPAVFLDCRYAHMIVRTQPRLILSALASNVLPVEEYVYFFAISTETIPEEDRQLGFIAIGRWK